MPTSGLYHEAQFSKTVMNEEYFQALTMQLKSNGPN